MIFFAVFLLGGLGISAVFRVAIDEMVGAEISLPDRVAGSALGALRVGLIAVTVVVVFDRLIPAGRDPAFLAGSQLRPILSQAGQTGLKSLPPETAAFIDQVKGRPQI